MRYFSSEQISPDAVPLFRSTATEISKRAGDLGINVTPFRDFTLPLFRGLALEMQKTILLQLQRYLDSLRFAANAGERLDDPGRAAWSALSYLGLLPPSEFFPHLGANSIVEFYSLDGLQIWRNFEFMKLCSYTLEEVYCLKWFKRYSREAEISAACLKCVESLLTSSEHEIIFPQIPSHVIEETCSIERLAIRMKFDMVARLKDRQGGGLAGFAVVSTGNFLRALAEVKDHKPDLYFAPTSQPEVSP